MNLDNLIQYLVVFFLSFLVCAPNLLAQEQKPAYLLERADELFEQEKYTQALEVYTKILELNKEASPRMLMRLAFIHEGLDNYTEALYYLSLLYRYAPDNQTLLHMEEIAQRYRLKGYEHSDFDFLRALYHAYFFEIVLLFLFFALSGLVYFLLQTLVWHQVVWAYRAFLLLFLVFAFTAISTHHTNKQVIIRKNNSYLMSDASGGASLRAVLNKGHRLEILNQQDIWYQVEWEGKLAYIRASQVFTVE